MTALLAFMSPRVWIAVALAVALAGTHWKAYTTGKQAVQLEWDAAPPRPPPSRLQPNRPPAPESKPCKPKSERSPMTTRLKRLAALLLISLLLTACASSRPPSPVVVSPPQIPPPPPELMTTPETASLPNVPELLSRWTKLLEAWQTRRALCRDTPQACV
jgi:hypothetical protein